MAEGVDNLILEHLRRFDRRLSTIESDLHDVKDRTSAIEQGVGLLDHRIDRVEERLGRIEKRLELVDS
jgi:hypothetical protein